MPNVFTDTPPTSEPNQIVAGDYLTWKRTDLGSDYDNSTYTLTYEARLEGSGSTSISITATASGDDYLVQEVATTTDDYTVGVYHWSAYITETADATKRITIDSGTWEVVADLATSTSDPRTHAKIMVDKIESLLEGKADSDVANYSIQGRSLTKLSIDELIKWRNYYKAETLAQVQEERRKNGKGTGRLIKASFRC